MENRDISVHITTGSVVKILLLLGLVGLLWYLRDIVLIVLSAVVIASAIEPGVGALMRQGANRLFQSFLFTLEL